MCTAKLHTLLSATLLVGCAHVREEVRAPVLETSNAEAGAPALEPVAEAAPAARPRLSRTVTLGQGTAEPYMPSSPSAAPSAVPNVVVNNQVVVHAAPPVLGYGYGSGYGYGYGGVPPDGYARPSAAGESRGAAGRGAPGWGTSGRGTSGWEGPRGTASPGQTPGVAGNWAPPPSHGPATMK